LQTATGVEGQQENQQVQRHQSRAEESEDEDFEPSPVPKEKLLSGLSSTTAQGERRKAPLMPST
jgi:hypothetical protein